MTTDALPVGAEGCRLTWDGAVALVTIWNPRRRNCLSGDVIAGLVQAFDEVAQEAACRAVVLTGAENYFSAGGDVTAMARFSPEEAADRLAAAHAVVKAIARLKVPVVAAVEGGAAGGGISLAVACDLVVVSDDARLVIAFDRVALAPDMGALYIYERRVGLSAARRLAYLTSSMSAGEAVAMGLMDELVPSGTALPRALEVAAAIAARSGSATAVVKLMLAEPPQSLSAALAIELETAAQLYTTADYLQAVRGGR